MSDDTVSIEVDGQLLSARRGAMLIEVTDAAGISIPRFCYHDKLSVAANCRMCLVEVEKAPKPMPACATPVMDGMKVYTNSQRAVQAQRGTMEFLLINHPLDCPICDQGGECELQDVAMGYGHGVSRYADTKRVVFDKDIGPLIATEMTRCIHCTRCVRFGEEIAGLRELGATGRGEDVRIGTYVEKSVVSEMSGNVIDLCPVGALTAKPSRYTARAWELLQHAGIATHDCVGSNLFHHTRDGRVMRVVPRENHAVNEVWLSDRDRFSYEGLYSDARLRQPLLKEAGEWHAVEWETALAAAGSALMAAAPQEMGFLTTSSASLEELYLLQKLARGLGCANVDYRLRQPDCDDQAHDPVMPWLGQNLGDLEHLQAALVVAGNVRKDQPLVAHRLRKAALDGAQVSLLNVRAYEQTFPTLVNDALAPAALLQELAGIAAALLSQGAEVPAQAQEALAKIKPTTRQRKLADSLGSAERATVLLGSGAQLHPGYSVLRQWASVVAAASGSVFGYLPEGGNAAGAWLAGCVPHRGPGGVSADTAGQTAGEMLRTPRRLYFLHGVDPEFDFADPQLAHSGLSGADCVIAVTAFESDALLEHADIILPLALHAEIDATYVNAEGRWQNANAAARPCGKARAGWKILRVLGNRLIDGGFDHNSARAVRGEVQACCESVRLDNSLPLAEALRVPAASRGLLRVAEVPIYAVDALTRHAMALQKTGDALRGAVHMSAAQAEKEKLTAGDTARVTQNGSSAVLLVHIEDSIPNGCVWIPSGVPGSEKLGPACGAVEVFKA
ncbi:MAG: NADH-quinone oxidoreductase subunit NuoG [Gammaproteobacteria bacterium]|nr:NADH-quinone oxidoreductase subunit NuoG [Gammaproteobacteria bacterium]